MMWGYYSSSMGWWMILSSLFWLVLLGVAVWALVTWVRHQTRAEDGRQRGEPSDALQAEEILRQRFARGEIDAATFQAMRAELEIPPEGTSIEKHPAMSGSPSGR